MLVHMSLWGGKAGCVPSGRRNPEAQLNWTSLAALPSATRAGNVLYDRWYNFLTKLTDFKAISSFWTMEHMLLINQWHCVLDCKSPGPEGKKCTYRGIGEPLYSDGRRAAREIREGRFIIHPEGWELKVQRSNPSSPQRQSASLVSTQNQQKSQDDPNK